MSTLASSLIQGLFQAPLIAPNAIIQGSQSIVDNNAINFGVGNAVGQSDGAFAGILTISTGTPVVLDLTNPAGTTGIVVAGVAAVAGSSHLMSLNIQNMAAIASTTFILTIGGGTDPIIAAMTWTAGPSGLITLGDRAGLAITSGAKWLQFSLAAGSAQTIGVSGNTRSA